MTINPIEFLFEYWQNGTIGLAILGIVSVVAVVFAVCKECKWLQ
jgi:hypothetical protein